MKIYYYSGATLPSHSAQSVHVMKMCAAFANPKNSGGHEVVLFGKDGGDDAFKHYGVIENFKLALARAPRMRGLGGVARLLSIPKKAREAGPPDLVYGRDPLALALFAPSHIPLVLESHHLPFSWADKMAVAVIIKRKNFAGMVVISAALKTDMLAAYPALTDSQIHVAHDGADIASAPKAKKLDGSFKAGYCGSLHSGKGVKMIIRLAQICPDIAFHVIGGDAAKVEKLRGIAPENLYLHGHVPHEETPAYLAAFDVALAPYQQRATIRSGHDIARWISPLKLFEYMAAKKPVIAASLPVIEEVLNDGRNALLVTPGDVQGWKDAMYRLRDEIELRNALAENAYKDLKSLYRWDIRAKSILEFIVKQL